MVRKFIAGIVLGTAVMIGVDIVPLWGEFLAYFIGFGAYLVILTGWRD